jgi:hypothetical protein
MATRHIFHLSIPVADLDDAAEFYVEALGARIGRVHEEWRDVLLWGHQITLQKRPTEVLSLEAQGKRHFGVVLPWQEWEALVERLVDRGTSFLGQPTITFKDTPQEQAKLYLIDPGHNVIEIKAYRSLATTLGYVDE